MFKKNLEYFITQFLSINNGKNISIRNFYPVHGNLNPQPHSPFWMEYCIILYLFDYKNDDCPLQLETSTVPLCQITGRFIYYRRAVLHLRMRMFHVRLSRCSTSLR